MKIARIDVSSTKGRATVFRSGTDIVINISRVVGRATGRIELRPDDSWVVPARPTAAPDRRAAARRLQATLDGVHGTNGDVAEYLRVIETFGD